MTPMVILATFLIIINAYTVSTPIELKNNLSAEGDLIVSVAPLNLTPYAYMLLFGA